MPPQLSIAVPCYNEAGNIAGLLERYRAVAAELELELVLVDNGSTDGTGAALAEALARPENRFARTVRVEKNIGYGWGLQAGLARATAPVVGVSHADLQCPPEDVLRAYRILEREGATGPCLVKGRRGGRPLADRFVTWSYNRLAALGLGLRCEDALARGRLRAPDVNAEPKLFSRELLPELARGPKDFSFDLWILHCARRRGLRLIEFDVAYLQRAWGKSKLAANPWMRAKTSLLCLKRIAQMRLSLPFE